MDDFDDNTSEPSSKRHKKHKKKHKHRRGDAESQISDSHITPKKSSIKLKLKLGKETMGTKKVTPIVQTITEGVAIDAKSSKKNEESCDDISDEEKWLDALEKKSSKGYGDIGKKDPALLTARQKALLHGAQDDLQELPSGYKTVELTDEQRQKRQEKAQRRRQQANEKMENDKTQTVHKLLKKQESKNKRAFKARGGKRSNIPRITYRSTSAGIYLHFPQEALFPLQSQTTSPYPETQLCGVEACSNKKTSVCSKTNVPVCSLQCYKKNLALHSNSSTVVATSCANELNSSNSITTNASQMVKFVGS